MRLAPLVAVLLSAGLVTVEAQPSANLLSNGSFEFYNGTSPPGQFYSPFWTLPAGSTAIKDWVVQPYGVDWIYTYWLPQDGHRSVDLSGDNPGGVSQQFATTPGNDYQVDFWLAGNKDGPPESKTVDVTVKVGAYENVFTWTGNWGDWKKYTFTFTATGPTSTLQFMSTTGTPYGPALDNVSVVDLTPELPSATLLVLGMVPVGVAWSRRRKR